MIDQAEKEAVCSVRKTLLSGQAPNRGLNGAELAAFPFVIDYDFVGGQRYAFCDRLRVGAEDDATNADSRVQRDFQQVLEEWASLIGDERLGRTHAAGSAAREDYGG
jgi:hypothetical protein